MPYKKVLVSDVEPLVEKHKGNVAAIARALGVSRGTVWNRCLESSTLMTMLEDARETMVDEAESVLYRNVLEGKEASVFFFLKTQGKHRGYVERQEVTGADGSEVIIKVVYDDANPDAP